MPSFRERFDNHPSPSPAPEEAATGQGVSAEEMDAMYAAEQAAMENASMPQTTEEFANLNMGRFPVDLVLKAIFFGAIFYLLSLPEVYKMTKKCCKNVDGVLLHSVVFAILYFVLSQFIN